MKPTPKPRNGSSYGMRIVNADAANGTWLEGEEFCYSSHDGTAMIRRCYAMCEDGQKRVVKCCIPDTCFSIPAVARIHGKRVRGFISSTEDNGFIFKQYRQQ